MPINSAFSLQGSNPNQPVYGPTQPSTSGTAVGRALSNFGNTNYSPVSVGGISTQSQTSTPQGVSVPQGSSPGLLPPTNQAVKSHTAVDGTQQTYYPPSGATIPSGMAPGSSINGTTGVITPPPQNNQNQNSGYQPTAPGTPLSYPSGGTPFQQSVGGLMGIASGVGNQTSNQAQTGLLNQTNGQPAQQNIQTLENIAQNGSLPVQQAAQNVKGLQQEQAEIASNPNVASEVASGRGQALTGQIQAGETALQNALTQQGQQITAAGTAGGQQLTTQGQQIQAGNEAASQGYTGQGQQITAGTNAAGFVQPQLGQYGQTYYQPLNAGQQGGGNLDPQTQAGNLAQQVISGKLSYQDAVHSMGYAGSAGQQFLNQAIQSANPNFNIQQAQTNAQTQGQLAPQGEQATQELNILQNTLESVPGLEQTSIPLVNQFSRWIGGLLGNAPTQELSDAQAAATSAVSTALGTAYGGTPTSFDGLVSAWFPPGATASQVQAGIDQFNALMAARQKSYSSPGTTSYTPAGGSTGGTSSGTANWPGWNP